MTDTTSGGFTVCVAEAWYEAYVAVIDDVEAAATALVVTVNVWVLEPAGTVTLAGTVATAVLLLESVTTAPPVAAADPSVTVPVEVVVPTVLVGLSAIAKPGEATVRVACAAVLL